MLIIRLLAYAHAPTFWRTQERLSELTPNSHRRIWELFIDSSVAVPDDIEPALHYMLSWFHMRAAAGSAFYLGELRILCRIIREEKIVSEYYRDLARQSE